MKISHHSSENYRGHIHYSLKRLQVTTALFALAMPLQLFAQAPVISYSGDQTYTVGTAISQAIPNAANVGAPGYAINPAVPNPAFIMPIGVTKDSKGNIYLADQTNNVIKELPVAGGMPVSLGSGFNLPMAIAVDPSGNLFVADYNNNAVKEVIASSGATVNVGSGFIAPYNVAVDSAGNIYVADESTVPLKELSPVGGYFISPSLPLGLTLDNTLGVLSGTPLVSSPATSYTIVAYNSSGSGSTTITIAVSLPQAAPTISYDAPQVLAAGSPIAPIVPSTTGVASTEYFSNPVAASTGISSGEIDLFLIMGQSNALGKGQITQSVPTVPGNIYYHGGNVYPANDPFLDVNTSAVAMGAVAMGSMWPTFGNTYYNLTGKNVCFVQAAVGSASLVTASDALYNGSWDTNGQLSYQAATQLQLAIDSLTILGYTPVLKGFLWDQGEADALAISKGIITSAAYTDTLVSLAKRFRNQFGATLPFYVFRTGAEYPPSPQDYLVRVRNAQEAALPLDSLMFIVTRNAVTFPARGLMNPDPTLQKLHYSQAGYNELGVTGAQGVVLNQKNPVSIQISASSPAITNSGAISNLPASIALDAAGNLYFSSAVNKTVVEVPAGGSTPVNLGSGFSSPFGIAVDGSGNVFVADAANNAIKEIPRAGGPPVTIASGFNRPNGVAVDALGDIFVADTYNNAVKEIPTGGGPLVIIGSGFNSPFAVALDQNGNLFVADAGNNAIKKLSISGGSIAVVGNGFRKPTGVAIDLNGNVYVADEGNNAIKEIPASGGNPIVLSQGYSSPFGIAVDANGNVYAPDDFNNGIREISSAGGYYGITPSLPAGLNFDITTGIISGAPVSKSPATNYSVTALNNQGSQTTAVNIRITDNVALSNLSLNNNVALSPSFAPGTTSYTANATNALSSVTVTPTASDSTAVIYVNGNIVSSGAASANIPLIFGNNLVTTNVAAADSTSKTYTINIIRTPSVNANLNGLTVSSGRLSPVFAAGTSNYAVSVANSVTSVTITPVAADLTAAIMVNGAAVMSGSQLQSQPLAVGPNVITIIVTAQDGTTTKTYTLTVTRTASSNDNLASIGPSIALTPGFSSGTTSYTTSVGNATASMTVKPVTSDANATIKVNGTATTSGTAFGPIPLAVGPNTISITVTAQDGSTTQTYTLTVTRAPSSNANLTTLKPGTGTFAPTFSSGTTSYTESVSNSVSTMTVTPTTTDANATIKVNGTLVTSGSASTAIALAEGANTVISTVVTAQDGTTTKTYTLTVTRTPSSNANLVGIGANVPITPGFSSGNTSYTASVSNATATMTVKPVTSDANATIKVNGTATTSGTTFGPIPLAVGPNTISITVTAQDGSTTQTYTLTVTRAPSSNANLTTLKPGTSTFAPTFSSGTTSYTESVINSVSTMTITPTATDANATIKVNGTSVTSGTASGPITLAEGAQTVIAMVVTAQDGTTTKTYILTVSRAPPSSNDNLASIGPSIALTPGFSSGTTSYTASVGNATASMTVKPVTSDANATIKVNGTATTSGTTFGPIPLAVGPNTISITVTAQDGSTTQTYTLTVTRAPSSNANLTTLKPGTSTFAPTFSSGTTSYTESVINSVSTMTITPTATDANATIKVNGTSVTSGTASGPITLAEGAQTVIAMVVTAQDGTTTKTYILTVSRAPPSSNDNLVSTGSNVPLTPGFLSGTTSYTASVGNATASMTVKPVTSDANATIKVNGTATTSGTTFGPIPLAVGPNTISITVTAQDGTTAKTYTLTVTRASGGADSYDPGISVTQPTESPTLDEDIIVVHQGVSPNGDGINDFLIIDGIQAYPDNKLMIMNRNGQLVFETQGYDNSSKVFDGHSNKNGQMQLPGTYFYQLDYTVNGIIKHKTGFIVLKY